MSDTRLTRAEIDDAGLADWRPIQHALHTRFRTRDFAAGLDLVNRIGQLAEEANHHPDLDLRYRHLNVRLYSHDVLGVTPRDIALARQISKVAAEAGIEAAPADVTLLELTLDTPDHARVKPFWRAIVGYVNHPDVDDQLRNDDGDLPALWFQQSGVDEPRQRFHLDIRVPADVAQQRVDAAVAAGGRVVDEAPSFVVLEDADGNRACVCRG